MEKSTAPIDTNAGPVDEETAKKHRISLAEVRRLSDAPPSDEPDRLPEPPTVRLRGDETPKRVLVPPVHKKRSWWRRFVSLFRRR
jgi:hypothetical protein